MKIIENKTEINQVQNNLRILFHPLLSFINFHSFRSFYLIDSFIHLISIHLFIYCSFGDLIP